MKSCLTVSYVLRGLLILPLLLAHHAAKGHGGVVAEDDLCLIEIGFYRAHFKMYQPRTRQHEQFCEDLPEAGESVFVMEYIHAGLSDVPIDFRIVRNSTGLGRFTQLVDVAGIEDIEEITVFHHPAGVQPDVFTIVHHFDEAGEYVGIVTIEQPNTGKAYTAVFPFSVGFTGFGYWPLVAGAVILLQLHYLWMTGRFRRRHGIQKRPLKAATEAVHG